VVAGMTMYREWQMPSITRPRTQPSKRRAETETAVLGAVERLLIDGASFTELSVQRIAEDAGVARSTFYLCFQDKTEVLLRLTSSMKDELFAMGEGWRPVGPDGGLDGLIAVFTRQLEYYRERAPLLAAIDEVTAYDEALRHESLQSLARFTKRTITRLREEQRAGRLAPGVDPVTAGQVLTWSGEQAIARQVGIGERKDDAKVARALAELQWFGTYRRP
jgi:AcrR family transcriptional regulator